jgi:L-lactate dehydrogenase complex protein LldF
MSGMSTVLSNPKTFSVAGAVGRWFIKYLPFVINNGFNPWYKQREMPEAPKQSFRDWYSKNRKKHE